MSVGGGVPDGGKEPTTTGVGLGVDVLVGVGLGSTLGGTVGVGVGVTTDGVGEAVGVGVAVVVHGPSVSPWARWAFSVTESSSTVIVCQFSGNGPA